MKNRTGLIALFLSALVLHDFFKIEFFKFGLLTLTYQRIMLIALCPIIFHPKFKINIKNKFLIILVFFIMYGLTRICGNYREFLKIYFPLLTFLFVYVLTKRNVEITFCIKFVSTLFIFFCVLGLIEIFTGYHFVETRNLDKDYGNFAFGMYYNENDFAAFLTTMIFFMLLSNYSILLKILTISMAVYIIYINGCQICLLALITFSILYYSFRAKSKIKRLILIFSSIFPVFLIRKIFVIIILRSSLYWRFLMYKTGIQVCKNNLLMGTGIGNYEAAMHALGFQDNQSISANPHCLILELCGQFGIIWAVLLIFLLIRLFLYIYNSNFMKKNFLLGLMYIYPFISIASSSALGKNYTYLALLVPLLLYKKQRCKYD